MRQLRNSIFSLSCIKPAGTFGISLYDTFRFGLILFQLVLIFAIIFFFNIEHSLGFHKILPFIGLGFLFHSFLADRLKLPFFFFLSCAAIYYIFGLINGSILLLSGFCMIGIVHLPLKYTWRIILLIGFILILTLLRAQIIPWSGPQSMLPILGSLFMFRLFIYMYELKYEKEPVSMWTRLTYFFMLPNLVFPIFPVVDYKKYKKSRYQRAPLLIYEKGAHWMFRGLIHLLAYRCIYLFITISPEDVDSVFTLLHYMVVSFALVLRLSGLFHLAVGAICLFGFDLPKIFNNYFLASSFSDLWRRINIYWKDFMIKVFYYPLFFKIRVLGQGAAILITIFILFIISWALHSWQWFWITGDFPVRVVDLLFWGIFGIVVALNALYSYRQTKSKFKLKEEVCNSIWGYIIHALKVIGIFLFMSILWSLWISTTLSEWILMMTGFNTSSKDILLLLLSFVVIVFVLVFAFWLGDRKWMGKMHLNQRYYSLKSILTSMILVIILMTAYTPVIAYLEKNLYTGIDAMIKGGLNRYDQQLLERGYYEELLSANNFTVQNLNRNDEEQMERLDEAGIGILLPSVKISEMKKNLRTTFKDETFTTNSFGLRDQEYTLMKPLNAFRFALLGGSYEMGSGVADEEVFEAILENKMNTSAQWPDSLHYQWINFGVAGHHLIQSVDKVNSTVLAFDPDVIVYTAHSEELKRALRNLRKVFQFSEDLKYDFLKELKANAEIEQNMPSSAINRRTREYGKSLIKWGYRSIADSCKAHQIIPVWIFIPTVHEKINEKELDYLETLAKESGFLTINIKEVYKNKTTEELKVSEMDNHPNANGHQLIALEIYEALLAHKKFLFHYNKD